MTNQLAMWLGMVATEGAPILTVLTGVEMTVQMMIWDAGWLALSKCEAFQLKDPTNCCVCSPDFCCKEDTKCKEVLLCVGDNVHARRREKCFLPAMTTQQDTPATVPGVSPGD